ncbi:MAG TPA: hypothetical protein EYP39_03980 [Ghiorsea sp.]|nr:hypothetical protein [Ghiorsea sp.]HIP06745.1 hypothetical protein [Mariprofundaceae bacterium]
MTSFLNASLPVLMQVNRSEGGTLLPWPNGSLLSGKIMPMPDAAGALLMLGSYRVRVEVPPNTPMGKVWLELLQREKPGQFRLLTDKQAISFISDMLQKYATKQPLEMQHKLDSHMQWSKQMIDSLPFFAEQVGGRLLLFEQEGRQAQGFVQELEQKQGFMLNGRLDLAQLGTILFSLRGDEQQPWQIQIHMLDKQKQYVLTQPFADWLAERNRKNTSQIEGLFSDGILRGSY